MTGCTGTTTISSVSTSSLFYLFADRVLDPLTDKWRRLALGIPAPCGETQVDMFAFAQLLLASAFWGLRQRGLIDLELVAASTDSRDSVWGRLRRPRRRHTDEITLHVVGGARLVGLEDAVMTHLRVGDTISVSSQIGRWLGTPCTNAVFKVMEAVTAEGASRGLCEPVEGSNSTYSRWLDCTAGTCVEAAGERIAALEPDFYETVAQWNAFATGEPELCCGLLHTCFDAVRERQFFASFNLWGAGHGHLLA